MHPGSTALKNQSRRKKGLTKCCRCVRISKLTRTISSAGMSIRLTCGGSQVQVLYRPPKVHRKKLRWAFFFIRPPGAKCAGFFLPDFVRAIEVFADLCYNAFGCGSCAVRYRAAAAGTLCKKANEKRMKNKNHSLFTYDRVCNDCGNIHCACNYES